MWADPISAEPMVRQRHDDLVRAAAQHRLARDARASRPPRRARWTLWWRRAPHGVVAPAALTIIDLRDPPVVPTPEPEPAVRSVVT